MSQAIHSGSSSAAAAAAQGNPLSPVPFQSAVQRVALQCLGRGVCLEAGGIIDIQATQLVSPIQSNQLILEEPKTDVYFAFSTSVEEARKELDLKSGINGSLDVNIYSISGNARLEVGSSSASSASDERQGHFLVFRRVLSADCALRQINIDPSLVVKNSGAHAVVSKGKFSMGFEVIFAMQLRSVKESQSDQEGFSVNAMLDGILATAAAGGQKEEISKALIGKSISGAQASVRSSGYISRVPVGMVGTIQQAKSLIDKLEQELIDRQERVTDVRFSALQTGAVSEIAEICNRAAQEMHIGVANRNAREREEEKRDLSGSASPIRRFTADFTGSFRGEGAGARAATTAEREAELHRASPAADRASWSQGASSGSAAAAGIGVERYGTSGASSSAAAAAGIGVERYRTSGASSSAAAAAQKGSLPERWATQLASDMKKTLSEESLDGLHLLLERNTGPDTKGPSELIQMIHWMQQVCFGTFVSGATADPSLPYVAILGRSGLGKSLAIGYLMNIPLVKTMRDEEDDSGVWDLAGDSKGRPIVGHADSCTEGAKVFGPYIDTAGLFDTHGPAKGAANAMAIHMVCRELHPKRLLFMLDGSELQGRGQAFVGLIDELQKSVSNILDVKVWNSILFILNDKSGNITKQKFFQDLKHLMKTDQKIIERLSPSRAAKLISWTASWFLPTEGLPINEEGLSAGEDVDPVNRDSLADAVKRLAIFQLLHKQANLIELRLPGEESRIEITKWLKTHPGDLSDDGLILHQLTPGAESKFRAVFNACIAHFNAQYAEASHQKDMLLTQEMQLRGIDEQIQFLQKVLGKGALLEEVNQTLASVQLRINTLKEQEREEKIRLQAAEKSLDELHRKDSEVREYRTLPKLGVKKSLWDMVPFVSPTRHSLQCKDGVPLVAATLSPQDEKWKEDRSEMDKGIYEAEYFPGFWQKATDISSRLDALSKDHPDIKTEKSRLTQVIQQANDSLANTAKQMDEERRKHSRLSQHIGNSASQLSQEQVQETLQAVKRERSELNDALAELRLGLDGLVRNLRDHDPFLETMRQIGERFLRMNILSVLDTQAVERFLSYSGAARRGV